MRQPHARLRAAAGLLTAAALLVGVTPSTTADAATRRVTETLNVRTGPGTDYRLLGRLPAGSQAEALASRDGWTRIRYGSGTAWVSSQYLAASSGSGASTGSSAAVRPGSVRATTERLNLRAAGSTGADVVTVLARGARVTLTGRTSGVFAEAVAGRRTGWASTDYLRSSTAPPAVVGTRVATAALDLRTAHDASSRTVGEVPAGTRLAITGVRAGGRAQIVRAGRVRWVTATYLRVPPADQPSAPVLPTVTGTRYATTTLDIRSTSADDYRAVSEVPRGTALRITGVVRNGRMQIVWEKAVRWVTAKYLSTSLPSAGRPRDPDVERRLKPATIAVYRASLQAWPQITTYYGWRRDITPDHPAGRALDIMIPAYSTTAGKNLGGQIAAWARANARRLDIQYVIWNQHIWNVQRDREGWRFMADRGGDSANHKNHVHITVVS